MWGDWRRGFVLAAAALLAAACASVPSEPAIVGEGDVGSEPPAFDTADYMLGSGDQLRVTVFDEPDLSGEFVVDGQGMVSLPLVGEVSAQGKSLRQFQGAVEEALAAGFLNNPRVSTEVLNYRPYYILGEVGLPGEYPYTSGLTVINAVATAQGFTYRANRKTVFIKSANAAQETPVRLSATTPVRPGDTIRIGERIF